jgi:hypothetical protein
MEVLEIKLERQKLLWETAKSQTLAKCYDEIASNRYKLSLRED